MKIKVIDSKIYWTTIIPSSSDFYCGGIDTSGNHIFQINLNGNFISNANHYSWQII